MSFMQPEIFHGEFYSVECNNGETHIVPGDVCHAETWGDLADYVEGTVDDPDGAAVCEDGWLCRMQAPGYCDSTDWSACETEAEACQELIDHYGCSDDGPPESWERDLWERAGSKPGDAHPDWLLPCCAECGGPMRVGAGEWGLVDFEARDSWAFYFGFAESHHVCGGEIDHEADVNHLAYAE